MNEPDNSKYWFQANEPVRNEQVTIGATNTKVSDRRAQQQQRKFIHCRNTGTTVITVVFGSIATANNGIVLNPNESFSDSSDNGYLCYQDQITAISSAAGGLLTVVER